MSLRIERHENDVYSSNSTAGDTGGGVCRLRLLTVVEYVALFGNLKRWHDANNFLFIVDRSVSGAAGHRGKQLVLDINNKRCPVQRERHSAIETEASVVCMRADNVKLGCLRTSALKTRTAL